MDTKAHRELTPEDFAACEGQDFEGIDSSGFFDSVIEPAVSDQGSLGGPSPASPDLTGTMFQTHGNVIYATRCTTDPASEQPYHTRSRRSSGTQSPNWQDRKDNQADGRSTSPSLYQPQGQAWHNDYEIASESALDDQNAQQNTRLHGLDGSSVPWELLFDQVGGGDVRSDYLNIDTALSATANELSPSSGFVSNATNLVPRILITPTNDQWRSKPDTEQSESSTGEAIMAVHKELRAIRASLSHAIHNWHDPKYKRRKSSSASSGNRDGRRNSNSPSSTKSHFPISKSSTPSPWTGRTRQIDTHSDARSEGTMAGRDQENMTVDGIVSVEMSDTLHEDPSSGSKSPHDHSSAFWL